ncbi:hypothetical protein LBMAG42_41950 [Deltaproteobacteria bacterium]|nr:hypothetical protein LBMAG42_41950 [Deltaproteobacteria bacterium]
MSLPHFFLPVGDAKPLTEAPLAQVCDLVRLGESDTDWAVVRDLRGTLRLTEAQGLPPNLARAVHAHELARGLPRRLAVRELWLFDLQLVEAPSNPPGANDPVEVYGRLTGPFCGAGGAASYDGRLALTRADLVAGFVEESPSALTVTTDSRAPERCLHGWLPGDRIGEIAGGNGAILAYKLMPLDFESGHASNEVGISELLIQSLERLQADLIAAKVEHPFTATPLPVLDREAVIADLESRGFTIQGDIATPNAGLSDKVVGALTSLFGTPKELAAFQRKVPAQGTLDDYLALGRLALAALPGWPDARANALRALVRRDRPGLGLTGAAAPAPPRIPANAAGPAPERPVMPPGPRDWSEDFAPRAATPAKTRPLAVKTAEKRSTKPAPSPAKPARPTWMDDFET